MTPELAIDLLKNLMWQTTLIAGPILLTGMVIGLTISLFQTVTSIQEQTLTFVPKALAISALLAVIMPWILREMNDYTTALFQVMPQMAR